MITDPKIVKVEPQLNVDRNAITISYTADSGAKFQLSYATEVMESTINELGLLRTAMLPSVPTSWSAGQTIRAYRDPAWSLEPGAAGTGDVLLHLRHEQFGWLHLVMTKDRARDLAVRTLAELKIPPGKVTLLNLNGPQVLCALLATSVLTLFAARLFG